MILFTGASGFLGANIYPILSQNYEIETLGLSKSDTYCINVAEKVPVFNKKYDIVLHAAGKAHSNPRTDKESDLFFQINLQGTINLCKALERNKLPKALIFISTVAVYGLKSGTEIDESEPLNGTSPYAKSKIKAEQFIIEWCSKHNVKLGILRPSLIAGKYPPGNLGAMISGISSGKYLRIGSGSARKSILMAEDIAHIIPNLARVGGIYNICDNHNPSFQELEELIAKQINTKTPKSIPLWLARLFAIIGDLLREKSPINSIKLNKIVNSLTFSNEKAKRELDWKPLDVLDNFKIY